VEKGAPSEDDVRSILQIAVKRLYSLIPGAMGTNGANGVIIEGK
jgi:hypothetical protein